MRCFIAIPLPGALREAIASLAHRIRPGLPGARFAGVGTLHLTLHFLGELDAAGVDGAVAALHEGARGEVAFDLGLGGPGVFPDPGRARVLWLGLREGEAGVRRLHERIGTGLRRRGLPVEARPFSPHLTLARWPRPAAIDLDRLPVAASPTPGFRVTEVVLFRSVLAPGGAEHTPLASATLVQAREEGHGG